MARAAMAALVVALQDPWSTAPAWGVPRASGRASQGGRASACAWGWGDRGRATSRAGGGGLGLRGGLVRPGAGHQPATGLVHGGWRLGMGIHALVGAVVQEA